MRTTKHWGKPDRYKTESDALLAKIEAKIAMGGNVIFMPRPCV
jgi:hypothetical protein